jgi:hypothetical protein
MQLNINPAKFKLLNGHCQTNRNTHHGNVTAWARHLQKLKADY